MHTTESERKSASSFLCAHLQLSKQDSYTIFVIASSIALQQMMDLSSMYMESCDATVSLIHVYETQPPFDFKGVLRDLGGGLGELFLDSSSKMFTSIYAIPVIIIRSIAALFIK